MFVIKLMNPNLIIPPGANSFNRQSPQGSSEGTHRYHGRFKPNPATTSVHISHKRELDQFTFKLKQEFLKYDLNRDGFISREEMSDVL